MGWGFAALLAPLQRALPFVRKGNSLGRVLPLKDFIALGVLRHLQGMTRLREQVQALLHLDPGQACGVALARSTWSDALSAPTRRCALKTLIAVLVREAREILPDRLAIFPLDPIARYASFTAPTNARVLTSGAVRPKRVAKTSPRVMRC